MPIVNLTTNYTNENFPGDPKEFNKKLATFTAEVLNRPVSGMFVNVVTGANFTVDATFEPAAIVEVKTPIRP